MHERNEKSEREVVLPKSAIENTHFVEKSVREQSSFASHVLEYNTGNPPSLRKCVVEGRAPSF